MNLLTNCSTSGGKGGTTVTVSTLEALESAVTGDDPRIVVVSGTISGAKKIFVGSNKSIIGRNGSKLRSSRLLGISSDEVKRSLVLVSPS
jgi:pectate lyase